MNKLLLVIDLQNDFINKNTSFLKSKIAALIESKIYNDVIFTRFINKSNSKYQTELEWFGCENDDGSSIAIDTLSYQIMKKTTYTSLNQELINYIESNNIEEIYLCGIDTECCVLKTALDLFEQNYNFYILKDCVACTHGKVRHNNALKILKRNIGIKRII